MANDLVHAACLWTRAAEDGHVEATYDLGMCYLTGRGVPRDKVAGLEYLRDAARLGHVDAQRMLPPCSPATAAATEDMSATMAATTSGR
jgi:TPR repeat protein